jgi:hypothetical protein
MQLELDQVDLRKEIAPALASFHTDYCSLLLVMSLLLLSMTLLLALVPLLRLSMSLLLVLTEPCVQKVLLRLS